jgi:hypothetical protein
MFSIIRGRKTGYYLSVSIVETLKKLNLLAVTGIRKIAG